MNYIVSASSDIGLVKSTNQDSLNVRVYSYNNKKVVMAILCDGMGGLSNGEVASSTVVNAFCKWSDERLATICNQGISQEIIKNDWNNIITTYNEKIKLFGKKSAISLGTTLTAMLFYDDQYYIVNVGDTRAYEISNYVNILTRDQTVVAREVEQGIITEQQAKVDPRRSVLLQCVGASDEVYPEYFFGQVLKDAVYMLCSDGFRHEITPDEIYNYLNAQVMFDENSMKSNVDALIELDKQRNERDNISVITVRTF